MRLGEILVRQINKQTIEYLLKLIERAAAKEKPTKSGGAKSFWKNGSKVCFLIIS